MPFDINPEDLDVEQLRKLGDVEDPYDELREPETLEEQGKQGPEVVPPSDKFTANATGVNPNNVNAHVLDVIDNKQNYNETDLIAAQRIFTEGMSYREGVMALEERRHKSDNPNYKTENFLSEVGGSVTKGLMDTSDSITSAPERATDMSQGIDPSKEGYATDWVPSFNSKENGPYTNTWWGGILQGVAHYGSLAWLISKTGVNNPMAVGAVADGLSIHAQEDNLSRMIEDGIVSKVPYMEPVLSTINPLATRDDDHPMLKTFKSVAEGMGIGKVFDYVLNAQTANGARRELQAAKELDRLEAAGNPKLLEGGPNQKQLPTTDPIDPSIVDVDPKVMEPKGLLRDSSRIQKRSDYSTDSYVQRVEVKILDDIANVEATTAARKKSVYDQTVEKAKQEVADGTNFRGHKNKNMADDWQGSPQSADKAYDVWSSTQKAAKMVDGDLGSSGSFTTPAQAERMSRENGIDPKFLEEKAKELMGDLRMKNLEEEAIARGMTREQVYSGSYQRMQEIVEGRNTSGMTPEEFWEPLESVAATTGGQDPYSYWAIRDVVAADLVNASIFKELRNMGILSREIMEFADVMDVDGPAKTLIDRLIVGMSNVKRSRFLWSEQGRNMKVARPTKVIKEQLAAIDAETADGVRLMMKFAADADDDTMIQGLMEVFSQSNKIRNWDDFDAWMRQKVKGGDFDGKKKTGALIKELQGVMVHSILSGPKTAVRALVGTAGNSILNPISQVMGATIRFGVGQASSAEIRAAVAGLDGYVKAIPEAFDVFKHRFQGYWSGDIKRIDTRFSSYTKGDEHWDMLRHWTETRGKQSDQAAFAIADIAKNLNSNKLLTASTKAMAAIDDSFEVVMARSRARQKAMASALEMNQLGQHVEITPKVLKDAEDMFYNKLLDADGNIDIKSDTFLAAQHNEATLRTELTGFAEKLDTTMNSTPWTKPFWLFARTGLNGVGLTFQYGPTQVLYKKFRKIMFAKERDLGDLIEYGITNMDELRNAKNIMAGRMAIGNAVIMMGAMHYMNGGLTGNGPQNRQLRQAWMDGGWQPRSMKVPSPMGDIWVGYEALEPFNATLALIADYGDHQREMGEQWHEEGLAGLAFTLGAGATTKTYMQGITQLIDFMKGDANAGGRIAGNLMNNQVPLGGLRNDIGKFLNPHQRELSSSMWDQIRNRNLTTEHIAGEELPKKYDILNGKPIRDWNFMERMYNTFSPISLRMDQGPGRKLLYNSNYDLRISTMSSPGGVSLKQEPAIRSMFQEAIGKYNLEAALDKLAEDPRMNHSVQIMEDALNSGDRSIDVDNLLHNRKIKALFESTRKKAWADIQNKPEVMKVIEAGRTQELLEQSYENKSAPNTNTTIQELLQMKNK